MQIVDLLCEYVTNPIGIDSRKPRLSWNLVSEQRGARQSAYQIFVELGERLVWDSGRVGSDQSIQVPYEGPALESKQRLKWKVRVWDENGEATLSSETAWWEMGLLEPDDWSGAWIGSPIVGGARTTAPCPYLRKEFQLNGPIQQARLYVSALGLFECWINGERVGEDVFTPGWTNYRKRVQYLTYDVTQALKTGENAIGAILGDGWYCGHIAQLDRQNYGDRPRFLAQLEVTYADGSRAVIVSDAGWLAKSGPILESDMIMGECYDARLEMPGWDRAGYNSADWLPVVIFDDPNLSLVAKVNPPVRRHEELAPVGEPSEIRLWPTSNWIFDLGQNMVGWIRLKVSGSDGKTVRMRFSEVLNPDGTLYTPSLRSARATDYYTLRGDGDEYYEARFTYHGFRYVELSGLPGKPGRDAVTGIVLHSDTLKTGEFECSNPAINQLQHNITWSQKGNFVEVPTDCPQRDERLGWTGDAQVFIPTAAYNMDVAAFFTKWQQDLEDSQSEIGEFPPVIPAVQPFGLTNDGGPAWADAGVICPWTIYQVYGDRELLVRYYDSMKRFVEYLRESSVGLIRVHPQALRNGIFGGFGDWLSTNAETPRDLIGTAYFAFCARLLARIAGVIGKTEDQTKFESLALQVKEAFIQRYITHAGLVAGLTQTGYCLALAFDLIPEHLRVKAVDELVDDIEKRDWHLSTGFVGTPLILKALTAAGRLDVAYKLLFQKTWPSWLYPVSAGATTIWERWDGWTDDKGFQTPEMNSFNHYAYGAVGEWLYTTLAGINLDPRYPGYKQFVLRPQPGGGISSAKGAYQSVYGEIISDWSIHDDIFLWKVTVPPNTRATAWVCNAEGKEVLESGKKIDQAEGITFLRFEDEASVLQLESGTYSFTAA